MVLGDTKNRIFQSSVIASLSRHKRKALQWSTEILELEALSDRLTFTIQQSISAHRDSKYEQWKSSGDTRDCALLRQRDSLNFWFIKPNKIGHPEQWWKPSIDSASCSRSEQQANLTFWFGNSCKTCPEDYAAVSNRNGYIWSGFRKGRQETRTEYWE